MVNNHSHLSQTNYKFIACLTANPPNNLCILIYRVICTYFHGTSRGIISLNCSYLLMPMLYFIVEQSVKLISKSDSLSSFWFSHSCLASNLNALLGSGAASTTLAQCYSFTGYKPNVLAYDSHSLNNLYDLQKYSNKSHQPYSIIALALVIMLISLVKILPLFTLTIYPQLLLMEESTFTFGSLISRIILISLRDTIILTNAIAQITVIILASPDNHNKHNIECTPQ